MYTQLCYFLKNVFLVFAFVAALHDCHSKEEQICVSGKYGVQEERPKHNLNEDRAKYQADNRSKYDEQPKYEERSKYEDRSKYDWSKYEERNKFQHSEEIPNFATSETSIYEELPKFTQPCRV